MIGAGNGWHNGTFYFNSPMNKGVFVPYTHFQNDKRFASPQDGLSLHDVSLILFKKKCKASLKVMYFRWKGLVRSKSSFTKDQKQQQLWHIGLPKSDWNYFSNFSNGYWKTLWKVQRDSGSSKLLLPGCYLICNVFIHMVLS